MAKYIAKRWKSGNEIPPTTTDRGYAWLVLVASVVIGIITSSSFMIGLFLVEFKQYFGISATRVSLVGALLHSAGMILGKCGLKKNQNLNDFPSQ